MQDRHERGLPVKRLVVVILVAALAWSGAWFWQAHARRAAIEAWAADLETRGIAVTWDDLAIRGFPNRLDSSFADFRVTDPQRDMTAETALLQVLSMVWNRDHVIAALPRGARVQQGESSYMIDGEGIRASLVGDGGEPQRLHVEAAALNLSGDLAAAMSDVTGAVTRVNGAPAYRVAFNADELVLSAPSARGALRLDATVGLAGDGPAQDMTLDDVTDIRLTRLELEQGALTLAATGEAEVAEDGQLDGRISVRAENLSQAIAAEREAGRGAPGLLLALEQAASLLSGLSGRDDSVDVTLEFRGGRTWVGILPIGPAPRLR